MNRKMKAVIGYWSDYYIGKDESVAYFEIGHQRVAVSHKTNNYYTIYYKWFRTDVHDLDIFASLALYERMLKGLD